MCPAKTFHSLKVNEVATEVSQVLKQAADFYNGSRKSALCSGFSFFFVPL